MAQDGKCCQFSADTQEYILYSSTHAAAFVNKAQDSNSKATISTFVSSIFRERERERALLMSIV